MESEKAMANAILCTYQDHTFPYEYIPSVFYNYDQVNVSFEFQDLFLHNHNVKSISLVKLVTLSDTKIVVNMVFQHLWTLNLTLKKI